MLKFVFLLTIWSGDVPQVFVADYAMTGADCIAALEQYARNDPQASHGAASCEVDHGEPWDELPTSGVFDH